MMRSRSPMVAAPCASSCSHTAWLRPAPANMKALQRANSMRRNNASESIARAISSKPLGTLKYTVGEISRRLRSVSAMPPGVGLPSSMYSVPPLASVMPTLWLPPKVWFHGSQSTSTGGSSARKRRHWRSICWLAHHMRCVLITPLGTLVEPDVNRNLAIVSGPTCSCAARSVAPGFACSRLP